jgi:hypothetical protein
MIDRRWVGLLIQLEHGLFVELFENGKMSQIVFTGI